MALNASLTFGGTVTETLAFGFSSQNSTIQWGDLVRQVVRNYTADTTPVGDTAWAGIVTLSAGTVTIAFDGLPRTGMTALDLTGKRIVAWLYKNLGANSQVIAGAGAQPYELFGHAAGEGTCYPNSHIQYELGTGGATVSASVSDITITGTGTQTGALILIAGTP